MTVIYSLTLLFSLVFCLSLTTATIEHPRSLVRGGKNGENSEQERGLFFFFNDNNDLSECQTKLDKCKAKTGGAVAPLEQMLTLLDSLNETDVGANDLKNALNGAKDVDYTDVGDELLRRKKKEEDDQDVDMLTGFYNSLLGMAGDLAGNFVEEEVASEAAGAIVAASLTGLDSVITGVIRVAGDMTNTNLKPVSDMVSSMRKILSAVPSGQVVSVAVGESIRYVGTVILYVLPMMIPSARLSEEEDAALATCTAEALSCEFEDYIMTVVPIVAGEVFMAKAIAEEAFPNV